MKVVINTNYLFLKNKELIDRVNVQDKITGEDGWISLGPWGGEGGRYETYKPDTPIMQITVHYDEVINSILFESKSYNGVITGSSVKIGGVGGWPAKFCIDNSVEPFSSVSLTYGDHNGDVVLTSLCFYTSLKTYGPFGPGGGHCVDIPIEGGVIAGFHGRGESYLNALGIFLASKLKSFPNSEKNVKSFDSVQDQSSRPGQFKDNIISEKGWISLGPWGGKGGDYSTYKCEGPIMQITIHCGMGFVGSILFESKSRDDVVVGSPVTIGGDLWNSWESAKFCIDSSVEQLSFISLTYGEHCGDEVLKSLCFITNLKTYGPFGREIGRLVNIPIVGEVVGFHGRGGSYLDAIGIFVVPKPHSSSTQDLDSELKHMINDEGWISLGPWGGKDGVDWAYKANEAILQINICYGEAINSILFRNRSSDGLVIESSEKKFGGVSGHTTKRFCIESSVEQLTSICLTFGDYYGQSVIKSLCFETNIGNKHGPFGQVSGASSSVSIPIEGGVIIGFHGRASTTYLTAIGVVLASKVNNLPRSEKTFDSLTSVQIPGNAPNLPKGKKSGKLLSTQDPNYASAQLKGKMKISSETFSTQDPNYAPAKLKVIGSGGVGSKSKKFETPTIKANWPLLFLVPKKLMANFSGTKRKTLQSTIDSSAASGSATTSKDDHHSGALSPSSEKIARDIPKNLDLLDSAFQKYKNNMDMQINEARQKWRELQRLESRASEFVKLGKRIAKLKFQIPLATSEDDHHGADLSPTSQKIHSELNFLDTAFAEARESMHHMDEKINQVHENFKELQRLQSSDQRETDKKELGKAISKLKVQIPWRKKIHSAHSDPHQRSWGNINNAKDGMTHFFHEEKQNGDFDKRMFTDFERLPVPLQDCLLCFFKFPPKAIIKRTPMIYLWIGQGYMHKYLDLQPNGYVWDVEVLAGKIFDDLKGFIKPIYDKYNYSLAPDSCRMRSSARSSLYEEAKRRGFISNGPLDVGPTFVCGTLPGQLCLINVGEAIVNFHPEVLKNLNHIQSLYLGRWQSSAEHHIELKDAKILRGFDQLKSLTFLSLRGISMIMELPTSILEINDLMILDLRACYNLEVIPDNIGVLKSLTILDMSECYYVDNMPKSLAQLSNLQVLKGFLIGDFRNNKQSCTLRNLSGLQKLIKLDIHISAKDLLNLQELAYLERFEGLQKLTISWGRLQAQVEDIAEAFRFATLPPRLQKLDLQCFPMTSLSNWVMPSKLKELKKLYIRGGQLHDLGENQKRQREQWTVEILRFEYLSGLEIYWKELRTIFPKLIYLHQEGCPKFIDFLCDKKGVWINEMVKNTHEQLHKYCKYHQSTNGMISSSSMQSSGSTSAYDEFVQ